jgi:hypothetical protein
VASIRADHGRGPGVQGLAEVPVLVEGDGCAVVDGAVEDGCVPPVVTDGAGCVVGGAWPGWLLEGGGSVEDEGPGPRVVAEPPARSTATPTEVLA